MTVGELRARLQYYTNETEVMLKDNTGRESRPLFLEDSVVYPGSDIDEYAAWSRAVPAVVLVMER